MKGERDGKGEVWTKQRRSASSFWHIRSGSDGPLEISSSVNPVRYAITNTHYAFAPCLDAPFGRPAVRCLLQHIAPWNVSSKAGSHAVVTQEFLLHTCRTGSEEQWQTDEKRNGAVYISLKQEGKRTTCLLADDVSPRNLMGGQQRWHRRQWSLVVIVVNLLLERAWEKQGGRERKRRHGRVWRSRRST